jgi:outer membrane protein OmpA-like peptidoglycan-associated protein
MIRQLQAPRTRGLRNLQVESAAASPSLSLSIQFHFDSAAIQEASKPLLANLALALQAPELADARFAIEGHTDSKGRAQYNLRLSLQRAAGVRDFLVGQGVDASRLSAVGKGSSEPVRPQAPQSADNRRVRVVALGH